MSTQRNTWGVTEEVSKDLLCKATTAAELALAENRSVYLTAVLACAMPSMLVDSGAPKHAQTHPNTSGFDGLANFTCQITRGGTIRAFLVLGRPQTHPNAPQQDQNAPQTHLNTPQTHPGKFHVPDCTRRHDSCFFGPVAPPDTPKRDTHTPTHPHTCPTLDRNSENALKLSGYQS